MPTDPRPARTVVAVVATMARRSQAGCLWAWLDTGVLLRSWRRGAGFATRSSPGLAATMSPGGSQLTQGCRGTVPDIPRSSTRCFENIFPRWPKGVVDHLRWTTDHVQNCDLRVSLGRAVRDLGCSERSLDACRIRLQPMRPGAGFFCADGSARGNWALSRIPDGDETWVIAWCHQTDTQ